MKKFTLFVLVFAAFFGGGVRAEEKGKWLPISDGILASLAAENKKVGYPGATAGVAVDPANGDVYVVVCDQGLWKSSDHGANFKRVDGGKIGGRCETGFGLNVDPAGKRLMGFMIYGVSARTLDGGATWQASKQTHVDCGAVDWSDPAAKRMLAIKHESGGELVLTENGGAEWKSLGNAFTACGIVADALVGAKKDGLYRSTDAGVTWSKVSDAKVAGQSVHVFKEKAYITSAAGVLVSADKGATWAVLGGAVKALHGPYFGKDEKHLIVGTKEGLSESVDAGASWKIAAPLPPGFTFNLVGPNFAYDAASDTFYASSMGKPAYKFQR